jgi:hypothetical protein
MERLAKESWPTPFNQMPCKLKSPTDQKKCQSVMPIEKGDSEGGHDQWNTKGMSQAVQGMAMLFTVLIDHFHRNPPYFLPYCKIQATEIKLRYRL